MSPDSSSPSREDLYIDPRQVVDLPGNWKLRDKTGLAVPRSFDAFNSRAAAARTRSDENRFGTGKRTKEDQNAYADIVRKARESANQPLSAAVPEKFSGLGGTRPIRPSQAHVNPDNFGTTPASPAETPAQSAPAPIEKRTPRRRSVPASPRAIQPHSVPSQTPEPSPVAVPAEIPTEIQPPVAKSGFKPATPAQIPSEVQPPSAKAGFENKTPLVWYGRKDASSVSGSTPDSTPSVTTPELSTLPTTEDYLRAENQQLRRLNEQLTSIIQTLLQDPTKTRKDIIPPTGRTEETPSPTDTPEIPSTPKTGETPDSTGETPEPPAPPVPGEATGPGTETATPPVTTDKPKPEGEKGSKFVKENLEADRSRRRQMLIAAVAGAAVGGTLVALGAAAAPLVIIGLGGAAATGIVGIGGMKLEQAGIEQYNAATNEADTRKAIENVRRARRLKDLFIAASGFLGFSAGAFIMDKALPYLRNLMNPAKSAAQNPNFSSGMGDSALKEVTTGAGTPGGSDLSAIVQDGWIDKAEVSKLGWDTQAGEWIGQEAAVNESSLWAKAQRSVMDHLIEKGYNISDVQGAGGGNAVSEAWRLVAQGGKSAAEAVAQAFGKFGLPIK